MESLPCELVHMIYGYVIIYKDVVRLSSVCSWLYENVPKEQLRVISIMKLYFGINLAISSIKYYIANGFNSEKSLRISNKVVVIFTRNYYTGVHGYRNASTSLPQFIIGSSYRSDICITYRGNILHECGSRMRIRPIIRIYFLQWKREIKNILNKRNIMVLKY